MHVRHASKFGRVGRQHHGVAFDAGRKPAVVPCFCHISNMPPPASIAIKKVDGGLRMAPLTRRDETLFPSLARKALSLGQRSALLSDLLQSLHACGTCERGTGTLTASDGLDAHVEGVSSPTLVGPLPGALTPAIRFLNRNAW
jgi:hypothetical protein